MTKYSSYIHRYLIVLTLTVVYGIKAQTGQKLPSFSFDFPSGMVSRLQGYRFTDSQHVLIKNGSDNLIMLDLARFSVIDHPRPEQALLLDRFNTANLNEQTVDDVSDPSNKLIIRLVNKRDLIISSNTSDSGNCTVKFVYDINNVVSNAAGTATILYARGNYGRSNTIVLLSTSAIVHRFSNLRITNELIEATQKNGSTVNYSIDNNNSDDNFEIVEGITVSKEAEDIVTNGGSADFFKNIDKSWLPSANPFAFSKDGQFLALPDERLHEIKIYDINQSLSHEVFGIKYQGKLMAFAFNNNSKHFLLSSTQNNCELWDVKSHRKLYLEQFSPTSSYEIERFETTQDNSYVIAVVRNMTENSRVVIWNNQSGKIISSIEDISPYKSVVLHPTLPLLLYSSAKKTISLYDIYRSAITHVFYDSSNTYRFSTDGKYIITSANRMNTTKFWSATNYQALFSFPGSRYAISPDNKMVLWDDKNFIYFFDVRSKKIIYKFSVPDSKSYVAINPEGYYFCSKDIIPKGAMLQNFDLKYNRPDKVLISASAFYGKQTEVLIQSYLHAYEKRVKLLGIREEDISVGNLIPELSVLNKKSINPTQYASTLTLHIKADGRNKKLLLSNIWVNEVPVYGISGLRISSGKSVYDTTLNLILSQGINNIEVAVTNENGIESTRESLQITYEPALHTTSKIFFAGIGINRFSDSSNNLSWSVKDMRDLTKMLRYRYRSNLVILDTLFDENVTVSNITALKRKLMTTTVDDKVIVAYSGHGLLNKQNDYFLSTYNINFHHPEEKGLPFYELENLLDGIPARQKLMFIDACHSGEVDKEELSYMIKAKKESGLTSKGVSVISTSAPVGYGMQNSFELMRFLFADLRKNTGTTTIAAAGGMQFALEKESLKNGVFTYSILEYSQLLWRAKRTVSDLKEYVIHRVAELTNGAQMPTSRSETMSYDWELW